MILYRGSAVEYDPDLLIFLFIENIKNNHILYRGSAAEYDPDYLLDQEIVLVTLQYRFLQQRIFVRIFHIFKDQSCLASERCDGCHSRLGMFGFLSTETKDAPGNYGMLDQVQNTRLAI